MLLEEMRRRGDMLGLVVVNALEPVTLVVQVFLPSGGKFLGIAARCGYGGVGKCLLLGRFSKNLKYFAC